MATSVAASSSLQHKLSTLLGSVIRAPAAWCYALLWMIAAGYLLTSGYGQLVVFGLIWLVTFAILGTITWLVTENAPSERADAPRQRRFLWLQVVALIVVILLTGYRGAIFNGLLPADSSLPLWTPFVSALEQTGARLFGNENFVANPALYFVVPVLLLLLLGARFVTLGFQRGHRVWRVMFIWCILPVLVIVYQLLAGGVALQTMLRRMLSNALNNGFFEEFLFRGALQTRLRALITPAWALVLQALIFGVWHLGLGYNNTGSLIAGLANTMMIQATIGLCFGVIFARTRNLWVSSVFHVLINSMGI